VRPAVAFLWHLHQPQYRLAGERIARLPWVRLHASRSYYDMVQVLQEFPGVRVTLNLAPVLLEQVRAYAKGGSDLFREAARIPAEEADEAQRRFLLDHFFSANPETMVGALPRYAELLERRDQARRVRGESGAWREFEVADWRDLQALFDLAWFGFKALEQYPELAALKRRGRGFLRADIDIVHRIQDDMLRALPDLYRAAAARGQIEIAASPYAHPILPLLIDTDAAREALPGAVLPDPFRAPDDALQQIRDGLDRVEAETGRRPRGVWPSEGSVSSAAVALLAQCGVAWAASDLEVLRASSRADDADPYRPWRLEGVGTDVALLFRDHDLSDRIGFQYARRPPDEAAEDLVEEARRRIGDSEGAVLLLALDGENPWETYPEAGAGFLRALYGRLQSDPHLATLPVGEAITACPRSGTITRLRAGSWIEASFGTWIGGPEKNRAWSVLASVRSLVHDSLHDPARPAEVRKTAWSALRAAEGSDWFWWLDGQFSSLYRADFDGLFRGHLRQTCEALGVEPPEALEWPIAAAVSERGTRTLASLPEPVIDGFETDYFEWYAAAPIDSAGLLPTGVMQRAARAVAALRCGLSPKGDLLLRLDPGGAGAGRAFASANLQLRVQPAAGPAVEARIALDERGDATIAEPPGTRACGRKILEVAVPLGWNGGGGGAAVAGPVRLSVSIEQGGATVTLNDLLLRWPGRRVAVAV
jgi:alpha-amylase/alpha-mannosidase (GH57 family)